MLCCCRNRIDQQTKTIYKYPTPTKLFDLGRMVVNGRHPQDKNTYSLECDCDFVIYVIGGNGTIYAGKKSFSVKAEDVVFVPKGNKYAVEGQMEYISVIVPAFYPEQAEEVQTSS